MPNFVVVSKSSADADDYETAVVFNATHKDADNEEAANDYLAEVKGNRPWQSHSVVGEDDFKNANDGTEKNADPVAVDNGTVPAPHDDRSTD